MDFKQVLTLAVGIAAGLALSALVSKLMTPKTTE